jgi:hypothetical protein
MASAMNEWLKTYGWLGGACFTGGGVAWQFGQKNLALFAFAVAILVVGVGLLSIVVPVVTSLFKWSRSITAAVGRLVRLIFRGLARAYVAALVPPLRPVMKVILSELPTTGQVIPPASASSWTARDKKYFMNSQRGDLRLIHDGDFPPSWVSFTCLPKTPYWRAGILLADESYDPQLNGITDAVLIHIGASPPEGKPALNVYLSRKKTVDRLLEARTQKYQVRLDFNLQKGCITLHTDGLPAIDLLDIDPRRWSRRIYLAAWGDHNDYEVVFQEITAIHRTSTTGAA